jgi:GT2 family glycosyltransferase
MAFMIQIAILSYNHPKITARCIESALRWSDKPLIVHNGSLRTHVEELQSRFPQLHHVVLHDNIGYSGGANVALRAALQIHPWALLLTNDCELIAWPRTPSVAGLYGAVLFRKGGQHIESLGGLFDRRRGRLYHLKSSAEASNNLASQSAFVPYIPGHALLLDRETFAAHGGFDESLFTYWEDVDLSLRYRQRHVVQTILQDFRVVHGGGKTCRKNRVYSGYYFQRNRRVMLQRYSPTPTLSKAIWTAELLGRSIKFALRRDWDGLRFSRWLLRASLAGSSLSRPKIPNQVS